VTLQPGTRLAVYEIVSPLGSGGMGEVYRARDTRLGREVAVKIISDRLDEEPNAIARFDREARIVASLSHPNIVVLHDVGRENGVTFAVMELLKGEPLDRLLAGGRDLGWRRSVEIATAVADGLASAHDTGVVHRDLKPANLFITEEGHVKILDFGLAWHDPFRTGGQVGGSRSDATQTGAVFGTVSYMSPEQVRGEPADPRSDIFSLACVLHEMLSGTPPFRRDTPPETLAAILRDDPPPLAGSAGTLPVRLSGILTRCLDKTPEHRFQSAQDLAFALRETMSAPGIGAEAFGRLRFSRARTFSLAALLVLVLSATAFWATARKGRAAESSLIPEGTATASAGMTTGRAAAYDAYVRGRHAWNKRGESNLREALRHFQQSMDADPTYAPAYVGLAESYGQLGYGSYISPEESFPRARAAATTALELDSTSSQAHTTLGFVSMYYEWDFTAAETSYKRAIALAPNDAIAHQWYAYLLAATDRPIDAEREINTASKLDPLSVPITVDHAYILHYYGRNTEALRWVKRALEMNPAFPPGHFWLGRIHTEEGRYEAAEAALQNLGPLRKWTPAMAALGYLYGRWERPGAARELLGEFQELARQDRYASGYAIALIHAGLGDRERLFSALDAAYRERSHWLVWLNRDPRWNDVRSDPRFKDLVRRVGLPS